VASTLSEVDEIRRHMAQIRHELHEDVQGVVRGAEATADWRRYIRNYPWAAIGLAFGVGYLIVPRRPRPQMPAFPYLAQPAPQAAPAASPAPAEPAKKKGKGIFRTVLGLAAPFALRTAQGYALQFFEQFLAQKMAQQQSPFTDLAASFMNQGQPAQNGADPMTNLRYPTRG